MIWWLILVISLFQHLLSSLTVTISWSHWCQANAWLLKFSEIRTLLNLQTFSLILNKNLSKSLTQIQLTSICRILCGFSKLYSKNIVGARLEWIVSSLTVAPYFGHFRPWVGWIPGISGFLSSAYKAWTWTAQILEHQNSFQMKPNSKQFPGNWTSKITFLTFTGQWATFGARFFRMSYRKWDENLKISFFFVCF